MYEIGMKSNQSYIVWFLRFENYVNKYYKNEQKFVINWIKLQ